MARRFGRFGGAARVGYGAAAIGAGFSKLGSGAYKAYYAIKARKGLDAGKGIERMYAGARALRSGSRNIRQGLHTMRGVKGHPFYGNQYSQVSRGTSSMHPGERGMPQINLNVRMVRGGRGRATRRISAGRVSIRRLSTGRRGGRRKR